LKLESEALREAEFLPSARPHYMRSMADKPKRHRDAKQLAKFIVDLATGEDPVHEPYTSGQRKGGLRGALSRSSALPPSEKT